jgi:hypothetical protein
MRIVSLCVLFIFLSSLALAQSEELPEILKPDAASAAEAQRAGAQVFKLVPFGKFADFAHSYKDEDNPIGIRGGGAYYSFSTGLHSYNKTPQISIYRDGRLSVGFYGASYGFFADLGQRDLTDVDVGLPETKYFLTYKPPLYEKDFEQEFKDLKGRRVEDVTLASALQAIAGDTYLLRAISWDEADIAVAFRVLKIDDDGSATIVWKPLAKFPKPFFLCMPDEELRQKIGEVIAEEKLAGIEFTVKDNRVVYIKGSNANLNSLIAALNSRGIRYRGETRQVR